MPTPLPDPSRLAEIADRLPSPQPGHAYGLKVIRADGTTDGRKGRPAFAWPQVVGAEVVAPDWRPDKECGGGLHLWAYGEGDLTASDDLASDDLIWHVVDYLLAEAVDLDGKVKVPRCTVVHIGNGAAGRNECATLIAAACPGHRTHFATTTAGNGGTATAGNGGTATAGNWGTATAGNWGTATAGNWGTATAGNGGTATAGNGGTATAGNGGTATAGNGGTAAAGYGGTATAGDGGTATAGDGGTATAGYGGTAAAGYGGTAAAGYGGAIAVRWYDATQERWRTKVGEVDGERIVAGVAYRVENGRFVRVRS